MARLDLTWSATACAAGALVTLAIAAPAAAQHHGHPTQQAPRAAAGAAADSAFAALQARGKTAMGVDQYTSAHVFQPLPDGGRIELRRLVEDSAGVTAVRAHLRAIAAAFAAGNFSTPEFVHMRHVPGAKVMAARRALISYAARDLPRGAELRITTRDPEGLRAVHEFLAFQNTDHRTDGGAARPRR